MSSTVVDSVIDLVAPILADLSLELYDCEFSGGVLKVAIDTPAGMDGGVDIDRIALVNRLLGRELDHREDLVPGRYTLEVTSPGLERTLRTAAHFAREVGKDVTVRLVDDIDGRRRLAGTLVAAGDVTATVRLEDGSTVEFPFASVERAKTVFVWESQPKPNSPEARRAKRAGQSVHHEGSTEVSAT